MMTTKTHGTPPADRPTGEMRLFDPLKKDARPTRPPRPARPTPQTIEDVCGLFAKEKTAQHALGAYSEKSLDKLKRTLANFCEFAGDLLVSEARQSDLIEWLNTNPLWRNAHTLCTNSGYIVSAFIWASKEGLIERCPFYRNARLWPIALPREDLRGEEYEAIMRVSRVGPYRKLTHRPRRRPESEQHRRYSRPHLHRSSTRAFRRFLVFMWETGCRVGEAMAMKWENIDFDKSIVTLKYHKTARKTGQQRTIAFPPKIKRLLLWVLRHSRIRPKPEDHVFLNGRGRKWNPVMFAQTFRKRCKLAGITRKLSPYCCRHGWCVRALEAGIPQRQIADVMGQASTRYVAWYGRGAKKNVEYLHGILDQMNGKATKSGHTPNGESSSEGGGF